MKYGIIYADMDGCLCNFEKGVYKITGQHINNWKDMDQGPRNKLFSEACDNVAFWANLEPMPDFSTYWGYIKYWKPSILTAYPTWSKDAKEYAIKGKMLWNRKHTMVPESNFHCVQRSDKRKFAMTGKVPNVLIDDHEKNISEWETAGGMGILHTTAVSSITKLKLLGFTKQ